MAKSNDPLVTAYTGLRDSLKQLIDYGLSGVEAGTEVTDGTLDAAAAKLRQTRLPGAPLSSIPVDLAATAIELMDLAPETADKAVERLRKLAAEFGE